MTKKDILAVFKFLKTIYPQFEVDQYKIDTWTSLLADQNPAKVMNKAERFALTSKFPPSLADLREPVRKEDPSALAVFWSFEQ